MNFFKTLAIVGVMGVGMVYGEEGSSNSKSSNSLDKSNRSLITAEQDDTIKRLQAAKKLPVPLPPTTPYDSDPKKRSVYLEEYQSGYRTILAAVEVDCHMGVKGETFHAYQDGWLDGKHAGIKDHPEKLAEMWGVPLETILQSPQYKSQHPSPTPQ